MARMGNPVEPGPVKQCTYAPSEYAARCPAEPFYHVLGEDVQENGWPGVVMSYPCAEHLIVCLTGVRLVSAHLVGPACLAPATPLDYVLLGCLPSHLLPPEVMTDVG